MAFDVEETVWCLNMLRAPKVSSLIDLQHMKNADYLNRHELMQHIEQLLSSAKILILAVLYLTWSENFNRRLGEVRNMTHLYLFSIISLIV
jgi:hypothetical protein